MERLQAAIARAREARINGGAGAGEAAVRALPVADAMAGADVWSALPQYQPERGVFEAARLVSMTGGRDGPAFDVVRTKVLHQMKTNGWKRIAITSPTAGCGKSTVSLNLGFSLSRQKDRRTILCEADLRRPSWTKMLRLKERHSFARVLTGEQPFSANALRYGQNFALSSTFEAARNPAETLHGGVVPEILAEIEAEYQPDIMIFDLPPLLVTDDALAFLVNVDCALLVAAAETSTVGQIDNCEREIASRTNMMGVVLNKCRYAGAEYGYGYGY
ncbi:chromosome partitioning ATPase-like protein [Tabrizicola sp. TH137]|nr:chromosome partitioning ATPase-like protein [Tabrizicola sp. TH137]